MTAPAFPVSDYERWYATSLGQAYLASLRGVLRSWVAAAAFRRGVDVGCGPGITAEGLFPPDARVWGIDCSAEMAVRARDRAEARGEPRTVVAGSADRLPFRAGSFELAFCVNCLEFVERRQAAFGEIARVLEPGGTLIAGVLNRRSIWEVTRRLRRPFTSRSYYAGRFFAPEELRDELTAAGFEVEEMRTAVHFPPLRLGPLRALYRRMDRLALSLSPATGGVILCRARKRPR